MNIEASPWTRVIGLPGSNHRSASARRSRWRTSAPSAPAMRSKIAPPIDRRSPATTSSIRVSPPPIGVPAMHPVCRTTVAAVPEVTSKLDRRGVVWGLVGVAITLAIAFVGSDGLVWFDAALVGYLFGIDLHGVRRDLPLRGVAPPPADGDAQPPRLGRVPRRARPRNLAALPALVGHAPARPGLHPPPLADPLARPPARLLGLRPRRPGDVPADARPAALRERRPGGRPLPGVHLAASARCSFDAEQRRRLARSTTPSTSPPCSCSPACSSSCAAGCATPGRSPPSAAATSSPSPACSPCR